jgi:WD40 repeat protein
MGYRIRRRLVVCQYHSNRVVIHDLETGHQKVVQIYRPSNSASSKHVHAIVSYGVGIHLLTMDGDLVRIVPGSVHTSCVAFHPHNTNILAIGFRDGTVRMWDVSVHAYVSSFKQHTDQISNIRFAPDGRLFLSWWGESASIVTLDEQFQILSSVKLEGHTRRVSDILPLFLWNQCVTCSDRTIKVWDCQTGACLRTLTAHTGWVISLALNPSGQYFASGSEDQSVIIWSCKTFEVLHIIQFPQRIQSLAFHASHTLYVGVYGLGVMSCNALTGKIGPSDNSRNW